MAARQGPHAREELRHGEGLDDVIVGAAIEPADALLERVARGDDDHRRRVAARAQLAQDIQAVHAREAQVEQDHLETVTRERGGRTAAILASLTSTCRRHDIDPQLYLTQLLVNLPAARISDLPAWLPDRWKATQKTRLASKQNQPPHA